MQRTTAVIHHQRHRSRPQHTVVRIDSDARLTQLLLHCGHRARGGNAEHHPPAGRKVIRCVVEEQRRIFGQRRRRIGLHGELRAIGKHPAGLHEHIHRHAAAGDSTKQPVTLLHHAGKCIRRPSLLNEQFERLVRLPRKGADAFGDPRALEKEHGAVAEIGEQRLSFVVHQ